MCRHTIIVMRACVSKHLRRKYVCQTKLKSSTPFHSIHHHFLTADNEILILRKRRRRVFCFTGLVFSPTRSQHPFVTASADNLTVLLADCHELQSAYIRQILVSPLINFGQFLRVIKCGFSWLDNKCLITFRMTSILKSLKQQLTVE